MRLISFEHEGEQRIGAIEAGQISDLGAPLELSSLKALLRKDPSLDSVRRLDRRAADYRLADVRLLPVIPDASKIFCVGINYLTHVRETGREVPKYPMLFTRFADSQVGHGSNLMRPRASTLLDFEGELAVIIGKSCRYVSRDRALEHVAGYSAYNDGSVRDFQRHTTQFIPGKNFPGTGGFGPWLVTADEFGDPAGATLTTRLNGNQMQHALVSDLIFDVPALVAYCSTFTRLEPGDVIVTGTPGGVGFLRDPPVYLKPGDIVEVEISGIGVLINGVVDEATE